MPARLDIAQIDAFQQLASLAAALSGTPPKPPLTPDDVPLTPTQSTIENQNSKIHRSTGPRTPEGKARSSMNALKHGLTSATSALMPSEDPAEYAQFAQDMRNDLRPRPGLESALVERIIQLSWRLRRVPASEAALFDHAREVQLYRLKAQNTRRQYKNPDIPPLPEPPESAAGALAALYAHCDDKTNPFARLTRYETSLDRALARCMSQLKDLQRRESCGAGILPASAIPQNELSPATVLLSPNDPLRNELPATPLPTARRPLPTDLQNELPANPHIPTPPEEATTGT